MAKEKINMGEMKLSDGKKTEELIDEELNKVVGGVTTMFPPFIPWYCQCGHYNATRPSDFNYSCKSCGQPRPPK